MLDDSSTKTESFSKRSTPEVGAGVQQKKIPSVNTEQANFVAAGLDKKTARVVNGLGSLMGTKKMVDVQNSNSKVDIHISEQPWTLNNWYLKLNWLNFVLVVLIPAAGFYVAFKQWIPIKRETVLFALFYYVYAGITITAGYHRLWAHRAYSARWPLRLFFAFFGSANVEGSIKWWGHSHRIHHRYTDTNKDPYDARKGLWYSHMGWMLVKPNPKYKARADISDLLEDPIVVFQHKHYIPLMFLSGFILPCLVCGYFFDDYKGGFLYAGIIRIFLIQQATFCINSLAHYLGAQPFDNRRTPRDNWITALVTFGEGYHNFHHEFPSDYRNAIKWYQYDPTKIFIFVSYIFGLSYNLQKFSNNAIQIGIIQQKIKQINKDKAALNWGPRLIDLPIWKVQDFVDNLETNPNLIVVSGIVHDITNYIDRHPGGQKLIKEARGKDATSVFNGGVYNHSNAANNVLATMRVAMLEDNLPQAFKFAKRRGEVYDEGKFMKNL
ncbi:hypothetical protein TBLA_0C06220 [Henningerozyma blattae CBS 6284]|uniref:Acyl-CoA desaturase n=1 Tax=Henningerozyma blattae (strain ATCC 34711 / CBS 6284 / DSM 70876 / NBRC 10599 / NRRL Y-10934 / UCD 77-7) TaxID=1071380 RepID=I2H216_HENB6|nr:hypothetical protein TBLA_0C06220 [Tetrapisispora blattae CBS 6284]CCH60418.1 hypothetical protein TBLA_0C06220 [Tetrapisispora blattae CBS 6284]